MPDNGLGTTSATWPTLTPDPAKPPMAAAEYDPTTGTYVGPDGRVYTRSYLARSAAEEQTWQTMVLPPMGN
jgi:phospholipid/cholesterol/gamma-HCH transport system substrate-binding protein